MANIIDKSLKASFCRQHFPFLLNFLRNFDISSYFDSNGIVIDSRDDLNMHYLLQAYEHKDMYPSVKRIQDTQRRIEEHQRDIRGLKSSCKWNLTNVEEQDVLLAIEEYFAITSQTRTSELLRAKLFGVVSQPENTSFLMDNARLTGTRKNYKFEDKTTQLILNYFNILTPDKKLSKQADSFRDFIIHGTNLRKNDGEKEYEYLNRVGQIVEEANFVNAFVLLANLRNWSSHETIFFLDDENNQEQALNFYRFILYTHIGIVYVCRRIWKRRELEEERQVNFANFTLENEVLEVNITPDDKSARIEDCCYSIDGVARNANIICKDNNAISFSIEAQRYQQIHINFNYKGESIGVQTMMTYYSWSPVLDIIVTPKQENYSFKNIAGKDNKIADKVGDLYSKYMKLVNSKIEQNTEKQNEILTLLSKIEPSLYSLRELVINENEKLKNNIHNNLLDIIKNAEENIINRIDDLNNTITRNQEQLNTAIQRLNNRFNSISNNEKEDYRNNKIDLIWYFPLGLGAIAVLLFILLFVIIDVRNVDYSVFYLSNRSLIWFITISVLFFSGLYIIKKYNQTKYADLARSCIRVRGLIPFMLTIIILFASFTYIPNKTINSLIANYDFCANNHLEGDNAKAARLMEKYLEKSQPIDDEQVRIQLANYYMNYANMKEKAIKVTEKMRDDVGKYKTGALYAAEAFYSGGEEYYRRVRETIEKYISVNKEVPPAINRLKGIMLCYGQIYDKNIVEGEKLLRKAADEQNDRKANYYLGHIYSHVINDWNTSTEKQDTLFNLIRAIDYYKKVANEDPKAAIELGNLYADLNMKDVACQYYQKALGIAEDSLKMDVNYRLGQLLESMGEVNNKYISEAIDNDYPLALLYAATRDSSHNGAIEYYENMGRYKGKRYIPPVVFEYILKGYKNKALDTLTSTRKNAHFNEEFVEGMSKMILDEDSIRGMDLMRISSAKGCKYAQMICLFRDMEKEIKENNYSLANISLLKELGNEISFANVLVSDLLAKKASRLDSIKGRENSESIFQEAAEYAIKAINKKNPSGALMFINSELIGYYFNHMIGDTQSLETAKHESSVMHLLLRLSPQDAKRFFILHGWTNDKTINGIINYKNMNDGTIYKSRKLPIKHLHFWSDVAISNHFLGFVVMQLNETKNSDEEYTKKLFGVAMDMISPESDATYINYLSFRVKGLLKDGFQKYIDSLKNNYQNDTFKTNILEMKYLSPNNADWNSFHFDIKSARYPMDNLHLLNEFCEIEDHIYDKPL